MLTGFAVDGIRKGGHHYHFALTSSFTFVVDEAKALAVSWLG